MKAIEDALTDLLKMTPDSSVMGFEYFADVVSKLRHPLGFSKSRRRIDLDSDPHLHKLTVVKLFVGFLVCAKLDSTRHIEPDAEICSHTFAKTLHALHDSSFEHLPSVLSKDVWSAAVFVGIVQLGSDDGTGRADSTNGLQSDEASE